MGVRLVLWDIDHTLIELRRLHYTMYARAFEAVYGTPAGDLPNMAGRTDRDSSTELISRHGIEPTEAELARFWAAFSPALDEIGPSLADQGHALAGAEHTLAALAERDDLLQSVLTGNLRVIAQRKLAAFGFEKYLDFDIGGYGEDDTDRAALVDIARRRTLDKHRVDVAAKDTVLIGDTPLDIAAAQAAGARVVAVATGLSSQDELTDAGADAVLADLTDVDAVVTAILDGTRTVQA